MATLVSTITYLTTPGEIITNGFGVLWAPVFLAFSGHRLPHHPRIMAHEGIVSGYQLLERAVRHGSSRRRRRFSSCSPRVVDRTHRVHVQPGGLADDGLAARVGHHFRRHRHGRIPPMGGIRAVIITDVTRQLSSSAARWRSSDSRCGAHSFTAWWPNLHDPAVQGRPRLAESERSSSLDPTDRITIIRHHLHVLPVVARHRQLRPARHPAIPEHEGHARRTEELPRERASRTRWSASVR